jgi:RNA polymerase sigma-70 factor (ECF subfamily)
MLTLTKSDEQLINLALNGSQRSWIKLVKRYENLVYNYCLRMTRSSTEAMDMMQEVFLAVYRNLPSYRGQNQFKAWLMRVTSNKTIDYLRHKERNPQNYGEDFDEENIIHSTHKHFSEPDNNLAQADNQKQVKALMQNLSPEQRMVVELKFFQQYTFEEIGMQLNVPTNTVKTQLYSALNKLKGQVEKQHVL